MESKYLEKSFSILSNRFWRQRPNDDDRLQKW